MNRPSLASFELLARRFQLILEAHSVSATQPDYSSAELIQGVARDSEVTSPALVRSVARRVKDQTEVDSVGVKVRELRQKKPGGGGYGGKGPKGGHHT